MDREKIPFEKIYEEEYPHIYRYINKCLNDPYTAEDIASEAFCKAFSAYGRYDSSKSSVRTWITRIAQNTLTDYYRKNGRRKTEVLENTALFLGCNDSYPVYYEESVRELYDAFEKLSEKEKEVLTLAYGSGLPNGELADIFGISVKAACERKRRAAKKLRRHYGFAEENTSFSPA